MLIIFIGKGARYCIECFSTRFHRIQQPSEQMIVQINNSFKNTQLIIGRTDDCEPIRITELCFQPLCWDALHLVENRRFHTSKLSILSLAGVYHCEMLPALLTLKPNTGMHFKVKREKK